MSKPYTPRKKKPVKIVRETKIIRINANTQIEVPVDVPDDVARERFFIRTKQGPRPPEKYLKPLTLEEAEEKPVLVPLEEAPELKSEKDEEIT
jgi:hypothetical protein